MRMPQWFERVALLPGREKKMGIPNDQGLGRSRGGFSSKLHLLCEGNGIPLAAMVVPGQQHENRSIMPLLDSVRVRQKRGRPRQRPKLLVADKAYDLRPVREGIAQRGIRPVVPPRRYGPDQHELDQTLYFSPKLYKGRHRIECLIGWLKECRRIGTRFEKLASHFLAMVKLAFIRRCLRVLFSDSA
jgi:transposase